MNKYREFIETVAYDGYDNGGLTVVGIGTDKYIADCVGPLTCEILRDKELKNIKIRGHFDDLFHGMNVNEKSEELDGIVVAIDASLSDSHEKGEIVPRKFRAIKPGAGVGKKLNLVGDHSVTGVVGNSTTGIFANTVRLKEVFDIVYKIVDIIIEIDTKISYLKELEKVEGL